MKFNFEVYTLKRIMKLNLVRFSETVMSNFTRTKKLRSILYLYVRKITDLIAVYHWKELLRTIRLTFTSKIKFLDLTLHLVSLILLLRWRTMADYQGMTYEEYNTKMYEMHIINRCI